MDDPISLTEFNSRPHLSPAFFQHGLELVDDIPTPYTVEDSAVLRINSWEVIRYKVRDFLLFFHRFITILLQYKLFEAEGSECETLNNFCTCHLEGEDRTMAVFTVSVPTLGNYYLRLVQHLEAALLLKSCNFCWYGLMDCSPSCNKYLTRMLAIFGSIY